MDERKIVLAVDDMTENLTLIRTMLEDYFDVRLAKSSNLALSLLKKTHVDLILLDIEMPGMTGFEFMKKLKSLPFASKDIPVIMVTSHAAADLITRAINEGAKDYIVKPIKASVLYKKINAVIGMPCVKTMPHPLEEKLNNLLSAALSADSARTEILMNELSNLAVNESAVNRRFVEEIGKKIKSIEYDKAILKIKELLANLPP